MEQRLQVRHVKRQLPRIRSHTEPRVESHISYKKHRSKVNSGFVPLLRVGYGLVSHVPHGPAPRARSVEELDCIDRQATGVFHKRANSFIFYSKSHPIHRITLTFLLQRT